MVRGTRARKQRARLPIRKHDAFQPPDAGAELPSEGFLLPTIDVDESARRDGDRAKRDDKHFRITS